MMYTVIQKRTVASGFYWESTIATHSHRKSAKGDIKYHINSTLDMLAHHKIFGDESEITDNSISIFENGKLIYKMEWEIKEI